MYYLYSFVFDISLDWERPWRPKSQLRPLRTSADSNNSYISAVSHRPKLGWGALHCPWLGCICLKFLEATHHRQLDEETTCPSKVILLCLLHNLCRCSWKILFLPSQTIQKHRLELSFPLVSSLSGTSGRAMLAGGSIAGRVLGEPQPWRESKHKQGNWEAAASKEGHWGACNHHFLQGYKQRRAMLLAQQRLVNFGESLLSFCHSCSPQSLQDGAARFKRFFRNSSQHQF